MKKLLASLVVLSALQSPVYAQSMMDMAHINTVLDDSSFKKDSKDIKENTEIFAPAPKNLSVGNQIGATIVGIMCLGVVGFGVLLIIAPLLPNRD